MIKWTKWTKIEKKKLECLLESLSGGSSIYRATEAAGIPRSTLYTWLDLHQDLRDEVDNLRLKRCPSVVWDRVYMAAIGEAVEMTVEDVCERGVPVEGMTKRKTKTLGPQAWAVDMFLRNRTKDYIQRIQPSDGTQSAAELAAELRKHMQQLDESDMESPTEDGQDGPPSTD